MASGNQKVIASPSPIHDTMTSDTADNGDKIEKWCSLIYAGDTDVDPVTGVGTDTVFGKDAV